jgi:hypothetical protein
MDTISEKTYFVNINGDIYETFGLSFADSVLSAVTEHENKDKDFSEFIYVTSKEDMFFSQTIYSPAFLCSFGFLSLESLYRLLVKSAISSDEAFEEA